MKLWKCDPYMPDDKGFVQVVVMAETRQQAIEKARAKLPAALGHVFPDHDHRRLAAQLGSDNLDNTMEEPSDAVVITITEPPSVLRDLA
jgi:hypothetical protein